MEKTKNAPLHETGMKRVTVTPSVTPEALHVTPTALHQILTEQRACRDYINTFGPSRGPVLGLSDWVAEEILYLREESASPVV